MIGDRGAAGLADAQQAADRIPDDDVAIAIPRAAHCHSRQIAQGLRQTARHIQLLELAVPHRTRRTCPSGDQKRRRRDMPTSLGTGKRPDFQRIHGPHPDPRRSHPRRARTNARWRPSGDRLKFPGPANSTVGGIWKRIGLGGAGRSRTCRYARGASIASSTTAAVQPSHGLFPRYFPARVACIPPDACGRASSVATSSMASPMSRRRFLESFARQRRSRRRAPAGVSTGRRLQSGSRSRIATIVSDPVLRPKAGRPVSSS